MDSPSESFPENDNSGIDVIDKAALVMNALESGPATLAQLVFTMYLVHLTTHRITAALESHHLVTRDSQGCSILGPRLTGLASAAGRDHLLSAVGPVLAVLRDKTHESARLYRRQGDVRTCVANTEHPIGLRDPISVGTTMSIQGGLTTQMLLVWEELDRLHRGLTGVHFTAIMLSAIRRRGWAQSVGERESGATSVSAPVHGPGDEVVAAILVSGPTERMGCQPSRVHGHAVMAAVRWLSGVLTDTSTV